VYVCKCVHVNPQFVEKGKNEEHSYIFLFFRRPIDTLYNKCIALSHCNKNARTKDSFEHLKISAEDRCLMPTLNLDNFSTDTTTHTLSSRIFTFFPRIRAMCTDLIFQSRLLTFLPNEALQHRGSLVPELRIGSES